MTQEPNIFPYIARLLQGAEVVWKPLGEVCKVVTDFTASGSFASNAKNIKYLKEPDYALLVRTTDLKRIFKNSENFIYVDKHAFEYLWRVNLDMESIILPNVGNCGEVYYSTPQILPYENCVLGPNAILLRSDEVNNKYLYYLFQGNDFQRDLSKITSSTGQTKFNKTNLKQIQIPLPPLSHAAKTAVAKQFYYVYDNEHRAGVAQSVEQRIRNAKVFFSLPSPATISTKKSRSKNWFSDGLYAACRIQASDRRLLR